MLARQFFPGNFAKRQDNLVACSGVMGQKNSSSSVLALVLVLRLGPVVDWGHVRQPARAPLYHALVWAARAARPAQSHRGEACSAHGAGAGRSGADRPFAGRRAGAVLAAARAAQSAGRLWAAALLWRRGGRSRPLALRAAAHRGRLAWPSARRRSMSEVLAHHHLPRSRSPRPLSRAALSDFRAGQTSERAKRLDLPKASLCSAFCFLFKKSTFFLLFF